MTDRDLVARDRAAGSLLKKDDLDHWVLKVKTQSKPAADLSIGIIIVVGHADG